MLNIIDDQNENSQERSDWYGGVHDFAAQALFLGAWFYYLYGFLVFMMVVTRDVLVHGNPIFVVVMSGMALAMSVGLGFLFRWLAKGIFERDSKRSLFVGMGGIVLGALCLWKGLTAMGIEQAQMGRQFCATCYYVALGLIWLGSGLLLILVRYSARTKSDRWSAFSKPEDGGRLHEPKGANAGFGSLWESFLDWRYCVTRPVATARSVRESMPAQKEQLLKAAIGIWITAFLISLTIEIPFLLWHGIALNNVAFHLIRVLCVVMVLLVINISIFPALRLFGIPAGFPTTFILFTVVVGSYTPLYTILTYVISFDFMRIIGMAAAAVPDLRHAIAPFLGHGGLAEHWAPAAIFKGMARPILVFLVCVQLTMFVRLAAPAWQVDKKRLMDAVAFAVVVIAAVPLMLIALVQMFAHYVFVGTT
jgi:hypothetical protein